MINIEKFIAGETRQGNSYKYFLPNKVNDEWNWSDTELGRLLERASLEIGKLNSFSNLVPNINLFVQLLTTKEAVVSSKIEGTQTHFDEALLKEKYVDPERIDDWQEVNNYQAALNTAIADLRDLPISSRLILKAHSRLLQGVRGETKSPGEYRRSQNWLGGRSISDAMFVPPQHDHLNDLMRDFENFLHNDNLGLPMLMKAAIMHYQFETIHPFLDGNGRIGRLLIPLFLIEQGLLDRPLLYISGVFEQDKQLYYDNLTRVRTHNEMMRWIKYFLVCVEETAKNANNVLNNVLILKEKDEAVLRNNLGRRLQLGLILYKYLLQQPLVTIKDVQEELKITAKAAGDLVNEFVKNGILLEFTGMARNRNYAYRTYLNIFEGK